MVAFSGVASILRKMRSRQVVISTGQGESTTTAKPCWAAAFLSYWVNFGSPRFLSSMLLPVSTRVREETYQLRVSLTGAHPITLFLRDGRSGTACHVSFRTDRCC